jgi:hypothetical protein
VNTTIDELERRFYIENRQAERSALLEFEDAYWAAFDCKEDGEPTPEDIAGAPLRTARTSL